MPQMKRWLQFQTRTCGDRKKRPFHPSAADKVEPGAGVKNQPPVCSDASGCGGNKRWFSWNAGTAGDTRRGGVNIQPRDNSDVELQANRS